MILDEGWTKTALAKLRKLDSLFKEVLRFQGLVLSAHTNRPHTTERPLRELLHQIPSRAR